MNKSTLTISGVIISMAGLAIFSCDNQNNKSAEPTADISFKTSPLKTGNGPGSIETADFNKDGLADMVIANATDGTLSVFLNDGKGKFVHAAGSPFSANKFPNDIAITDVNNDGIPDLCIANTEASLLSVFIGNGKGQFRQAAGSPFPVHAKPHTHGIAAADFNADGNIDLATDDWGENKIVVLYGDGKGHFASETFFSVGKRPYQRLRSADINRDGKPDIVTTNLEGNNATVLIGQGDGKFVEAPGSPFSCGAAPFGVSIGDVNGDGTMDLAIVNSPTITAESRGSDGLWILSGDGKGGFLTLPGSPFKTGKSPSRVAIGDLDDDGINDIAVTNYNDKSISLFFMSKNGVRKTQTISAGQRPDGIAIKDINGDRKADILVCNFDDNTVLILTSK
ncbi:MAG: VCBS repeat-containing protein [Chitinophagaceae bacterium]|nr:VCBS repeat-containing protein [Chitinophagaceae bacterium]